MLIGFVLLFILIFYMPFLAPSWLAFLVLIIGILLIIAYTKWNSEKENADIRQVQLELLKKGKTNIELKGKMRKLK